MMFSGLMSQCTTPWSFQAALSAAATDSQMSRQSASPTCCLRRRRSPKVYPSTYSMIIRQPSPSCSKPYALTMPGLSISSITRSSSRKDAMSRPLEANSPASTLTAT